MSQLERKRNIIGTALLALVIILAVTLIWQNFQTMAQRDTAQSSAATQAQQKKNLAEEVADACRSGQVVKSSAGVDLCDKAATIAQQPVTVEGPQGPAGPRGLPGKDGSDGATGATGATGKTGPPGVDGSDGADGLNGAPGAAGKPGLDGTNGTPGPAGTAGKDGATGATGLTGADGRGIKSVECIGDGDASYWKITYTDGSTAQSSGPCKVAADPAPPATAKATP